MILGKEKACGEGVSGGASVNDHDPCGDRCCVYVSTTNDDALNDEWLW